MKTYQLTLDFAMKEHYLALRGKLEEIEKKYKIHFGCPKMKSAISRTTLEMKPVNLLDLIDELSELNIRKMDFRRKT